MPCIGPVSRGGLTSRATGLDGSGSTAAIQVFPYRLGRVQVAEGKCNLFVVINRTAKLAAQPQNGNTIYSWPIRFDTICGANLTEYRLTEPNHLWASGQIQRMNPTTKNMTLRKRRLQSSIPLYYREKRMPVTRLPSRSLLERAFP